MFSFFRSENAHSAHQSVESAYILGSVLSGLDQISFAGETSASLFLVRFPFHSSSKWLTCERRLNIAQSEAHMLYTLQSFLLFLNSCQINLLIAFQPQTSHLESKACWRFYFFCFLFFNPQLVSFYSCSASVALNEANHLSVLMRDTVLGECRWIPAWMKVVVVWCRRFCCLLPVSR